MATPEAKARIEIDKHLSQAGWIIQDANSANINAGTGVVIREFPLKQGHGVADYLFYVSGKAAGVIEAKPEGTTLTGVEIQSEKYITGFPDDLPCWVDPLPFSYESTGIETQFSNNLDPDPRSRKVFHFHTPEYLKDLIQDHNNSSSENCPEHLRGGSTFLHRMRQMPQLIEEGLWAVQIRSIQNIEESLKNNRPRALVQMATGSGKTFMAISLIYRLIKFAGIKRVLFLVDRGNLAEQTENEFQQFQSPYNNFRFHEEFIVQRLQSNRVDPASKVCICTIQRMYSMLRGYEIDNETDESSGDEVGSLFQNEPPIEYNPEFPISLFDLIITDECHRSIYHLWRQILEYYDAYLLGLTATPTGQTMGFFNRNLVMEYNHDQAVADGVNVNYDVYRIRTQITEDGSRIDAGNWIDRRDRLTRSRSFELLDDDFDYEAGQLDRDVVAEDQIQLIVQTFRDRLPTEIFPGRTEVPKTLVYAKDDSHADDIVRVIRREFNRGNSFAQKITYKTTGRSPKELINEFRNSYEPRIAVTVDMIATGTDIKPVEIVMFMRSVRSRSYFDQMKGRGVRIINPDDLRAVTPDAYTKDRFLIVDAVGVCEIDKTDSRPLDRRRHVSLENLLRAIAFGNTDSDVISSASVRLARLGNKLTDEENNEIADTTDGQSLNNISSNLVRSINPDSNHDRAVQNTGLQNPSDQEIAEARESMIQEAVQPLMNPLLREKIIEFKNRHEQVIDSISQDTLIEAGFNAESLEKAQQTIDSFKQIIEDKKDEITALQIIYNRDYKNPIDIKDLKKLAETISQPPHLFNTSLLWQAYAAIEPEKVKRANTKRLLTDIVSLVRFALEHENELVPYPEKVENNFQAWLAQQSNSGRNFSEEQLKWLMMIRDHISGSISLERDDFEYAPFNQKGGLGMASNVFGDELMPIVEELNEVLAA